MRTQRFNEWARLPDPTVSLWIEKAPPPHNRRYCGALFALYCKNKTTRYNDDRGSEFGTAIMQARSISAITVLSTAKYHTKAAKNRIVHATPILGSTRQRVRTRLSSIKMKASTLRSTTLMSSLQMNMTRTSPP